MKIKHLFLLTLFLVGCSHYNLRFVDIANDKPSKSITEKTAKTPPTPYIVVHYVKDDSQKVVRIDNIAVEGDHIIADTLPYLEHGNRAELYTEARKRLKPGKTKIERPISPSAKMFSNQMHIYVFDKDSIMKGDKLVVPNDHVGSIHDMDSESGPPTFVLFIILAATGGLVLIILIIYAMTRAFADSVNASIKEGCYVATNVYGSYEAPEVWTLRRFRDGILAHNIAGRLFIKVYYALSPGFVERNKHRQGLNKAIKWGLDRLVSFLRWKYNY